MPVTSQFVPERGHVPREKTTGNSGHPEMGAGDISNSGGGFLKGPRYATRPLSRYHWATRRVICCFFPSLLILSSLFHSLCALILKKASLPNPDENFR
jgi:hypothetical protein